MTIGTVIRIKCLSFRMALHVPMQTRKVAITLLWRLVTHDFHAHEIEYLYTLSLHIHLRTLIIIGNFLL
jgi:hypothetical protein